MQASTGFVHQWRGVIAGAIRVARGGKEALLVFLRESANQSSQATRAQVANKIVNHPDNINKSVNELLNLIIAAAKKDGWTQ